MSQFFTSGGQSIRALTSASVLPMNIQGYPCPIVKNKVPIDVWVYLWALYLVSVVFISVFLPVPYCLDDCRFVV